ncbi:Extracellular exo-alpha-L-arabinofuranosidase precursor [Botrimarina colliarenosi]|uniref:non-reducing end alpha-L-arabinofuranosidase n=1 Tax=Botrimarina colliarenosi TaxID=2528001 RepID=A0A5C6A010_9BACT|nr:alpha-L-arabinofuranosidase C-terminal domain-containing protein [Botrimarina colliarenosi]TWT92899.1 Extracellular exo-alpha-L-arabinofuranosidase precursor [Botrimarina colliarenosi]
MSQPRSVGAGRHLTIAITLCAILGAAGSLAIAATEVTVHVDCDQPGHAISPRLVGAFFEDINFGGDGGLNAELIKNGSFEVPRAMLGWRRLGEGLSAAVEHEAPFSAGNPSFIRLRGDGSGALANEGFRGIGVHQSESLRLAFWGRAEAGKTVPLAVRLVGESGEALATKSFELAGSSWRLYETEIAASQTDKRARLELSLPKGGTIDLDLVSLCPVATWRDRPHGLRRDLVQLLADLKPAFFRFPGGCIVEGSQLKYRYDWKTTIGPRETRRLIVNRWNTEFAHRPAPDYYQSFALGFFEYFQLADDIGAEPLPIINCGMACQFNTGELVPLEELQPYIQDALDLIEFANGPVTSEWGATRAAMGRTEPFNLRMLGVGNEQWGPEYFERYERFAEALQREHPEIELVSTSGPFPSGERFDYAWPQLRKLKAPIVDEHCYAMPDWFLREAHRYDDYDRNGPEVFMGEYAAQSIQIASPRNRNTLRCAIAEAAFLTGIERNSDIVTMSAYAPLFAHEEAWQWRPDLIWFDNLKSYGTPSYYVQQAFSLHRGDTALPVAVEDARPPLPPGGRFGLGTHETIAEFREVSVTSSDGAEVWSATPEVHDLIVQDGEWRVSDAVIANQNDRGSSRVLFGDPDWSGATLRVQARKLKGREGFTIFFRCRPGGSRIEWNLGGWGNRQHGLIGELATHSTTPVDLGRTPGEIEQGRWYDVRVETKGSRIRCYLDDELIHEVDAPDPPIDRVFAASSRDDATGETIVKIVNATDESTDIRLELNGLGRGSHDCRIVEIAGDPEAANSIDQPMLIRPIESTETIAAPAVSRVFPPHSLTVLRISPEGGTP